MSTREEVEAIRKAVDGLLGKQQAVQDIKTLLSALDDANKRIADLQVVDAKLAKVREWANEFLDDSSYAVLSVTLNRVLGGKDPK